MSSFPNLLLCILIALFCPQIANSQNERKIDPQLQAVIDGVIQGSFLKGDPRLGLTLAIIQNDGELFYTNGYGMANLEKNIPVTNSTQYLTTSVSKGLTALMTVKVLRERFPELGESVLHTPVRKLIPEADFTLIDRYRSEQVTFADLLSHRICTKSSLMQVLAGAFETREELLYRTRYSEEACAFRGAALYNNQMISLAGILAASLVNKSYEDAMQDLFTEMGMDDTTLLKESDDFSQMPQRAQPYFLVYKNETEYDIHPYNTNLTKRLALENPASGVMSSSNDMSKYLEFHLSRGKVGGKEILPENAYSWLIKPYRAMYNLVGDFKESDEVPVFLQIGYGLGFVLSTYDDWHHVQHGGYAPPYLNQFSFFPGKKLGIFTSSNMGPISDLGGVILLHLTLFEILRGNVAGCPQKVIEQINAYKETSIETVAKEMGKFVVPVENITLGVYGSGSFGDAEVTLKPDPKTNATEYYLEYGKWFKGWLRPSEGEGDPRYVVDWDTDVAHDDFATGGTAPPVMVLPGRDEEGTETLTIFGPLGTVGNFKLGLRSDDLPPIPWDPDSC